MTWHIVGLAGPQDTFTPDISPGDQTLLVPLDIPTHRDAAQSSVPEVLAAHNLIPSQAAYDFLCAAIAAYTADVRIARSNAFDGWTRDLTLHLPVQDMTGWSEGEKTLARLLRFLTGDHWLVHVRPAPRSYRPLAKMLQRSAPPAVVSLFSGGLDSFIGAVDLLEQGGQVALVGHHSAGGGPTSIAQTRTLAALRTVYPASQTSFLQFWLSPPRGQHRASEITTRGRSILFLGLGVMVASALATPRLIVPENGFISLNVPLTAARLGSFSTRTTHPHLIALLRTLLAEIGVAVQVTLPYRFSTKGEMIRQCANTAIMERSVSTTMSCARPGASRFTTLRSPNIHCGYCVPCLIRRAAIGSVMPDPTVYTVQDLAQPLAGARGVDLRAFKMALDRYRHQLPQLTDILAAGPLSGTDEELYAYLAVFRRGLNEMADLLHTYQEEPITYALG